jgi:UDP-4-amino-4,6-dideoxy-N-acetyl-beta-L-altrosamine transaminase
MIPYGHQDISEEDIEAVVEVLRSDYLTQGPAVPVFEQVICDYTEAKYGVAVNSGTSALHIACLALELGKGDWLWTTPITFVASANCGLYCDAKVDFVDIDPITWNLSAEKLEEKLKEAEREGKLPKVIVAVHLCGLSCDMEKISNLSKQYGFSIIEDASHALGGQYQEKNIGNGQYSDISTFSFHPIKNITTGEGGMAVTNNPELAEKMRRLRSHGITSDPALMTHSKDGLWYYQQIELGFNYRMSDLHAALGISQLKRLDEFIANRRSIAKRYDQALSGLSLQLPSKSKTNSEDSSSAYHLYIIRLQNSQGKSDRKILLEALRDKDVQAHVHYIPLHTQPYYQQFGFKEGDFPEAENYYSEAMTLPIYSAMSSIEQDTVVRELKAELQSLGINR